MKKYYLMKITYKNKNVFLIWYSDDEDGFLLSGNRLLMFACINEVKSFAEKQNILFEAETNEYDFSNVFELVEKVEFSENCRTLIDIWHFFSDLSKSLSEQFMGDSDESIITDIYNQLFYGINLDMLKNEEYHPILDDEETKKCISILSSGLSILDKQLDLQC